MTLEVLIVTLGQAGVDRCGRMELPRLDGVSYLFSIQNPDNETLILPDRLRRPDVRWTIHITRGISVNRNHAFDCGKGDILVIGDDDLNYSAEGLLTVKKYFEEHPCLDFLTFKSSGADNKYFPDECFDFGPKNPRGYYLTSFEMALRRDRLPQDLRFSTYYGIGSPYFGCAEENVFLVDLVRRGLRGRFLPVVVAEHTGLTTGSRRAPARVLRSQGGYLRYKYGAVKGLLKVLRDAPRRPAPLYKALYYMIQGYIYQSKLSRGHA